MKEKLKLSSKLLLLASSLLTYHISGYGVDCSFPIHHLPIKSDCEGLLDRTDAYKQYVDGCIQFYSEEECSENELDRIDENLSQPQSMMNFTSGGFRKVKAPPALRQLLSEFWEINKDKAVDEDWPPVSIATNHWEVPTKFLNIADSRYEGGGRDLADSLWNVAEKEVEEWTGWKMRATSIYGVRIYKEGSVLSPHVDRVPLISSCIINVAQDVDEDWPLEVYDRFGNAINITMEPFDMVFYESHSLIHGRPFPLKGRYYANIFIHFETTGEKLDGSQMAIDENQMLPPYIFPGSPAADVYLEANPTGWSKVISEKDIDWLMELSSGGDLEELKEILDADPRLVNVQDDNGWSLLHYGVSEAQLEIVKMLLDKGANINARTEDGVSPHNVASGELGEDHELTKLLEEKGADTTWQEPEDDEDEDDDDEYAEL